MHKTVPACSVHEESAQPDVRPYVAGEELVTPLEGAAAMHFPVSLRLMVLLAWAYAAGYVPGGELAAQDRLPGEREREEPLPSPEEIGAVRAHIKEAWRTLTRSHADLLEALPDSKVEHRPGDPWPLYIAATENADTVLARLRTALTPDQLRQVDVRVLPVDTRAHLGSLKPGLLYLPNPYVVPGGRFNEMYGWDSYFIQVGLLRDGELELAKNMADNFLYEIEHYGTILNANRTYYLTRSQPPFLTSMILGVYEQTQDHDWLASTLPAIEKLYAFWTAAPHLAGETGLSRYYDFGEGPAPEVVFDERDELGRTHYDRVAEYFRTHEVTEYDKSVFYDSARHELTPLFYKGDRSMRESGFDPSNKYGPFNADIIHYASVALNALLYKMEQEAAYIYETLGRSADATQWRRRAAHRQELVDRYLWDEEAGQYFDYNFQTERRRPYEFATTFYPLWVGLASPDQAARVAANLYKFEAPGGILTSTHVSGSQWDAPFGWAPLQMIAAEGLARYGHHRAAERIAARWISLVTKEFNEHGVIVEKYDVVQRQSDVSAGIRYGYSSNEIGFGWTNAVYLVLLDLLD